jgi:hypothetical protein
MVGDSTRRSCQWSDYHADSNPIARAGCRQTANKRRRLRQHRVCGREEAYPIGYGPTKSGR